MMVGLIAYNPYRTLGVYVNSTLKERLTNINRFKAFDKVGKSVDTEIDFNAILKVRPNRSITHIESAVQKLTLPIDQLKQSLFWFASSIPADEIAMKNLRAGDLDKARTIECKFAIWSSLLNFHTLSLLAGDLKGAVSAFSDLATTYRPHLLNGLGLTTLDISEKVLVEMYYHLLSKEFPIKDILYAFKSQPSVNKNIVDILVKRISEEYVEKINKFITIAKDITKTNPDANLQAAITLKTSSYPILKELKELSESNSIYNIIADKIALQVLQNCINYYNASNDEETARHALPLIEFSKKIAVGQVAQERCCENYEILRTVFDQLPPESALYYHRLLTKVIEEYNSKTPTIENTSLFIDSCFPYLMSIRSLLGVPNLYYTSICTRVAEIALENLITDYNKKSKSHDKLLEKCPNSQLEGKIIQWTQEMMKSVVISMYHIKHLGLKPDFYQNRFSKNYESIIEQARNARALGANCISAIFKGEISNEDFNKDLKNYAPDLRDEMGYYSSIKNLQDCYEYRRIFPDGKFTAQVNSKVEEYEYLECSSLEDLQKFSIRYPSTKFDIHSKREEIVFKSCKTIEDYKSYIAKYSKYRKEAEKKIDDILFAMCHDKATYAHYLATYPYGGHRLEAQQKIDDIDYRACKTANDFERYISSYPNGIHINDAKKRMEEENLWSSCVKKGSWKLYKEYLNKYPSGKYKKQAIERSISPFQRLKRFFSNNGCLTIIVILFLSAIITGACTHGLEGVGAVFAGFAFLCGCITTGKGDIGGETRLFALILAIISGLIAYGILS